MTTHCVSYRGVTSQANKMWHSFRNQKSSSALQQFWYYPWQRFIFVINPHSLRFLFIFSLPVVHTFTSSCPYFHFLLSIFSLPVAHTFTSCFPYFHFLLPIFSLHVVNTSTSCCSYFHFLLPLLPLLLSTCSLPVHTFTSCPYCHFLLSIPPLTVHIFTFCCPHFHFLLSILSLPVVQIPQHSVRKDTLL